MNGQLRIEEMFAFVALDPEDNTEGVVAVAGMPLVGADMEMVDKLRPAAQMLANIAGIEIMVLKFSVRDQVGLIHPAPPTAT